MVEFINYELLLAGSLIDGLECNFFFINSLLINSGLEISIFLSRKKKTPPEIFLHAQKKIIISIAFKN